MAVKNQSRNANEKKLTREKKTRQQQHWTKCSNPRSSRKRRIQQRIIIQHDQSRHRDRRFTLFHCLLILFHAAASIAFTTESIFSHTFAQSGTGDFTKKRQTFHNNNNWSNHWTIEKCECVFGIPHVTDYTHHIHFFVSFCRIFRFFFPLFAVCSLFTTHNSCWWHWCANKLSQPSFWAPKTVLFLCRFIVLVAHPSIGIILTVVCVPIELISIRI